MKNPYFTFLSADNYYATTETIDPQLLSESLKSFHSYTTATSGAVVPAGTSGSAAAGRQTVQQNGRNLSFKRSKQCRIRSPPVGLPAIGHNRYKHKNS